MSTWADNEIEDLAEYQEQVMLDVLYALETVGKALDDHRNRLGNVDKALRDYLGGAVRTRRIEGAVLAARHQGWIR